VHRHAARRCASVRSFVERWAWRHAARPTRNVQPRNGSWTRSPVP
jgi:hypothetical protein